ncbi:MAG TPA: serine/threonine-protein kinase [Gemmataceae bacterium]|jgi:serine/threonine protein kinase|nr:serine/threonine-protein kinase [Gemmataceae bacterium]
MTNQKVITRAEFAQNLADCGLLDVPDLPPDAPDGAEAARALVAAGKLTWYQADAILDRKFADLRIGNYEILDRLGAGGMGTVFKARHRRMKRVVALKVLSKEVAATELFLQRFQREVEVIARLTHPNIVMAFDADEAEAGPFLVMEFVNGRDLASEVQSNGPLPVADAVDRIIQAARGLEYAHEKGIIHRDIKPHNLMRDADGTVKVADLGLARIGGPSSGVSSLTQAGSIFGTVDYMSPEQAIDSGSVDARADIYSLGCSLYFLLTGQPPYGGGTLMAQMLKHRDAPIPSLRAARPDVSADLDAVFARMVAKSPKDRPASMAEVVRELERVRPPAATLSPTTIFLPAAPTNATDQTVTFESPLAPTDSESPLARVKVVVAEPSRTQAGIIRNYLKQLGIEAAHSTGSGREVIETVKRTGAGFVISALHLSDMTGVELATALRADPGCATVGFVLATSESGPETTAALPQDARTVVMPKPFDVSVLMRSLTSAAG